MMRDKTLKLALLLLAVIVALELTSCKACRREAEPETTIAAAPLVLEMKEREETTYKKKKKSDGILRIDIGPSRRREEDVREEVAERREKVETFETNLPPNTVEESDLTARLRDKMSDAYGGREEDIPDVKIYLSEMKYDEFVKYYQDLGYNVHTVAVPAVEVIEPVLEQRPELAGKINLSDYEDVVIHQVMINDAGISAADKYIDPDTFEVVDKTFVTKMNR